MLLAPRAKRVINLAYDEARLLNNNYIGTEHLLLGLIREDEGLAGRVLRGLGVDLERTRHEVIALQNAGAAQAGVQLKEVPGKTRPNGRPLWRRPWFWSLLIALYMLFRLWFALR